jgi:hypothetical protein
MMSLLENEIRRTRAISCPDQPPDAAFEGIIGLEAGSRRRLAHFMRAMTMASRKRA